MEHTGLRHQIVRRGKVLENKRVAARTFWGVRELLKM